MAEPLLGRYRLIRRLATGGMGEVFLARQEGPAGFARLAVVKRILGHLADRPDFIQMFLEEARLAAVLSHPNVVQIFELGEEAGTWFIAMEYLHGRSLRELLRRAEARRERINPVQAARIMGQALEGLHYAHTAKGAGGVPLKLVHRDVSPDNVLVGFNGVVKMLDFGIAKAANAMPTTGAGVVKGKFAYMAPEQLRAEPLDGRADVFAAGIVLYELLSNARPFASDHDASTIQLILDAKPAPPLEPRAPSAPPELCAAVMKALEKSRERRWQSAAEFAGALEQFVSSVGEAGTNAGTAVYLRALFGAEAAEDSELTAPPQPVPTAALVVESNFGAPPTSKWVSSPDSTAPTRVETTRPAPVQTAAATAPAPAVPVETPPLDAEGPSVPAPVEEPPLELDAPLHPARPAVEPPAGEPPPRRLTQSALAVAAAVALALLGAVAALKAYVGTRTINVPTVEVTSDPPGATLKIAGERLGVTPWSGSNLWKGEVTWEVSAPGRVTQHGTFHGGAEAIVDARLPKSGR